MNIDTLPPIVRQRVIEFAAAQHVPPRVLIIRALIRHTGLEGIPIPESEIWGEKTRKENKSGS